MTENYAKDQHYVGNFHVLDENIAGEIVYNKERGVILLNLAKTCQDPNTALKSYGTLSLITGKLNTGAVVTLFDNRRIIDNSINFRMKQLVFSASYMIWSNSESLVPEYDKMICVLKNAYSWSGLTAFRSTHEGIRLIEPFEQKTCHWFNAKIVFTSQINNCLYTSPDNEETKIVQRLQMEIEPTEKKPLSWFTDVRDRIIALISFSIKNNVNLQEEYLLDFDKYNERGNGYKDYYKNYLITATPQRNILKTSKSDRNLTLDQLSSEKDINNTLLKLIPIFNLYLSLFKYRDMPTEMAFLNIVQALETFHSRFFYDNEKNKYIESVKKRFLGSPNEEKFFRLLLSDTQIDDNCRYIILVSRLNDLLISTSTGLFNRYFLTNEDYAQTIADTRHYYTHYGASKEKKALKGKDLLEAIYVLQTLLEYHVCLVLGVDNEDRISKSIASHNAWKELGEIQSKQISQD